MLLLPWSSPIDPLPSPNIKVEDEVHEVTGEEVASSEPAQEQDAEQSAAISSTMEGTTPVTTPEDSSTALIDTLEEGEAMAASVQVPAGEEAKGSDIAADLDDYVASKVDEEEETTTVMKDESPVTTATEDEATAVPTPTATEAVFKDEEDLAEKYRLMSLEDKAFAILSDLGMLEVRVPVSSKATYEEEEEVVPLVIDDPNPSPPDEGTTLDLEPPTEEAIADQQTDEADEVGNDRKSIKERVMEPIRAFFSQPRTEPMFPSSTPKEVVTPSTAPDDIIILEARRQPKSPEEEAALAPKYGQIPDLCDRAYAILKDLGMV